MDNDNFGVVVDHLPSYAVDCKNDGTFTVYVKGEWVGKFPDIGKALDYIEFIEGHKEEE
jgi:hypothetical protein